MTPTEKYIQENEAIHALRRIVLESKRPKKIYLDSISGILVRNLISILRCAWNYPIDIFKGFNGFRPTLKLKGGGKFKRAIVIGNGPSQGYLNAKMLDDFVSAGGETLCINYWNLNENLSSHVPTWMLFSDPATFVNKLEPDKSQALIDYLQKNPSVKVAGPGFIIQQVRSSGLRNAIFTFVDCELPFWKNIHPLFPRGYLSMTLYKALAWAVYLGYSEVGLIGMDNTYPRNLYCDENNRILNLETHAGIDDYVVDQTGLIPSVAVLMQELFLLFRDLECFPTKSIVNLDPYSLTDRFTKISLDQFLYTP